jgi:hypothetical protein
MVAACKRKGHYRSQAKAKAEAILRRSTGASQHPLFCYECPVCGQWHLTKIPR